MKLVNVKDFGAKIDGVTDDRAAIQAAVDYAKLKGLSVFYPTGAYNVSGPIKL